MAAYRADIEIGVKGAAKLKELQDRITRLSRAVDDVNVKTFIDGKAVQSLAEYAGAASKAATNLRETAIQLNAAGKASGDYADAISQLVTAVGQENAALELQNNLIKEEIELRRRAKLAASGIRETTQYAGPIGPGQASPVALSSRVEGRIRRILAERQGRLELNAVLQDQFEVERQLQNSKLDEKAAKVQEELDKQAAVAAESAAQIDKLNTRQEEFITRTNAAARAAARQTAEFYRQARAAKEVAKINAAAGPAQLLLAPAAPGSPAMGGGARRRITGAVERLGGARTADEAAATLRLAQATDELVKSSNKIDPQYNRFLPDTATLNATGRGIQRLTTNQEEFNQTVQRGIRFEEKYNQELQRRQRLGIGGPVSNRMPGTTGVTGGPFPVEGPIPLSEFGRRAPAQSRGTGRGAGIGSRLGGAVSGSIIGGAFPLLFGQGGGAAAGGAIGGLVGGLAGPGGSFAGSLLGTLLGDIASRGQAVKQLGEDLGFSAAQAKTLADAFKTANTNVEKFTAVIQNIRGVGLELEEQATAVQLVTALTEKYGGSFEKVGNAVTSALESGKVSQAVLNQLTNQGITVQDALAAKYNVSRDKILEMAKKGEISVQSLLDTLIELGNASTTAAEKTQTPFEKALATTGQLFQGFWKEVQAIFAGISSNGTDAATRLINLFNTLLQEVLFPLGRLLARIAALFIDVVATGARAATDLITGFRGVSSAIGDAIMNIVNMIPGLRTIVGLARQLLKGVTGRKSSDWNDMPWPEGIPKPGSAGMIGSITAPSQAAPTGRGANPPEDRTAQLQARLQGLSIETNAIQKQLQIRQQINKAELDGDQQLATRLQGEERIQQIITGLQKDLIGITDARERQALIARAAANIDAVQVQTVGELAKIDAARAKAVEDVVSGLDMELLALQANTDEQKQALQFLEIENQLKKQNITLTDGDAEAIRQIIAEIYKAKQAQDAVNAGIEREKQLIEGVAGTLVGTLTSAFDVAVEGSQKFGEALKNLTADLLATIGKMLVFYAIGSALKALAGGKNDDKGGILTYLAKGFGFAEGGYISGGFRAFANGGMVTRPTMGLIGEGGEPEYVIPSSKMAGAMSRYASGARGSSVIPQNGDSAMAGGGGGGGGTFTLETVVINNVEYATVDQVRAMGQQAASQGAQGGFNRSMRTLQNSRSQRARIGLR